VNPAAGSLVQGTTNVLNYTRAYYDLEGLTTKVRSANQKITNVYKDYEDLGFNNVERVINVAGAFVIIALVVIAILAFLHLLYFADSVRDKILFHLGMTVLRVILLGLAFIVLVGSLVAFLAFLGITDAFDEDITNCTAGYCRKFIDSTKRDNVGTSVDALGVTFYISETISWGAEGGWYLVLACIPLSLFLLVGIFLNKFPIPIDSIRTGEAL